MALTREQILNLNDLEVKEIEVPAWGGETVFIKPLTRGQQDGYLKRQYGHVQMTIRGGQREGNQEASIYGHDAYLCVCGICDEDGKPEFKMGDIPKLEAKLGQAIGEIAIEIVQYSGMTAEKKELDELEDEATAELQRIKN